MLLEHWSHTFYNCFVWSFSSNHSNQITLRRKRNFQKFRLLDTDTTKKLFCSAKQDVFQLIICVLLLVLHYNSTKWCIKNFSPHHLFSHYYQLLKAEKENRIQKYYSKLLLSAKRKTLAEKGETIIIGERVLLGKR